MSRTRVHKVHVYRSTGIHGGAWRWRLKAPNGRIIADSGEAYSSKAACIAAAERLIVATIVLVVDWP